MNAGISDITNDKSKDDCSFSSTDECHGGESLPPYPQSTDVWKKIAAETQPIVVYGMGNGADKLLVQFEKYGITVSDFFASDGFVRGHSFHGKRVLSFSEIKEKYEDFVIVVSFASRLPEVAEYIAGLDREYTVYIPDMPVCGEEYFTCDFYNDNYGKIRMAYELLSDNMSRSVYLSLIRYRLSGSIRDLMRYTSSAYDCYDILGIKNAVSYLDGGAYNGDTVKKVLDYGASLRTVVAAEPDEKTYRRLLKFADTRSENIICIRAALWSADGEKLSFSSSGNRNSSLENKSHDYDEKSVDSVTVDSLSEKYGCFDYIKFDLEGAEREAVMGAVNTIKSHQPSMLVSVYHRSADIFDIIFLLKNICGNYSFFLRREPCFPAWEINLLAVPGRVL